MHLPAFKVQVCVRLSVLTRPTHLVLLLGRECLVVALPRPKVEAKKRRQYPLLWLAGLRHLQIVASREEMSVGEMSNAQRKAHISGGGIFPLNRGYNHLSKASHLHGRRALSCGSRRYWLDWVLLLCRRV